MGKDEGGVGEEGVGEVVVVEVEAKRSGWGKVVVVVRPRLSPHARWT